MYKLYDYYRSSASYRVRLVLNYKELNYDKQEVHLVNNGGEQHSEKFKQTNHQELVPALEINNTNEVITQSLAIIEYLEETHPKPSILPELSIDKAKTRTLANIIACDTHPLNNLRVLKYLKSELDITEEQKNSWYHHWLRLSFTSYEYYVKKYNNKNNIRFSINDQFTLADACLIPQVYNALRFELDISKFPNIMQIYEHCLNLPFVNDAKP